MTSRTIYRTILTLSMLPLFAVGVAAQETSDADTRRALKLAQIEARAAEQALAAAMFLDTSAGNEERLAAARSLTGIRQADQAKQAAAIAVNRGQDPGIRARAVTLLENYALRDPDFVKNILGWLEDPDTPAVLRDACADTVFTIQMALGNNKTIRESIVETQLSLTDDPDIALRRRAYGRLAPMENPQAIQKLEEGLFTNRVDILPPNECGALLKGIQTSAPALLRAAKDPYDEATLLAIVPGLARYPEGQQMLQELIHSETSSDLVKLECTQSLFVSAPESYSSVVLEVLQDDNLPNAVIVSTVEGLSLLSESQIVVKDLETINPLLSGWTENFAINDDVRAAALGYEAVRDPAGVREKLLNETSTDVVIKVQAYMLDRSGHGLPG